MKKELIVFALVGIMGISFGHYQHRSFNADLVHTEYESYKVEKGDTLGDIALKFYPSDMDKAVKKMKSMNNLMNDTIMEGSTILVLVES